MRKTILSPTTGCDGIMKMRQDRTFYYHNGHKCDQHRHKHCELNVHKVDGLPNLLMI